MDSTVLFILNKALSAERAADTPPLTEIRGDIAALVDWLDNYAPMPNKPSAKRTGLLAVLASTDGRPGFAQVRAYPAFERSGGGYTPARDGRIEFWRTQTNEHGRAELTLPLGQPILVEVTRGCHVSTDARVVELQPDRPAELRASLTTLVDLRGRGILCGDMHHHSVYSSPKYGGTDHVADTAADVYGSMRAAGLDFGALSDHHNTLNHAEWKGFAGDGFTPIISKEISTSNGHVNQHGAAEDVVYHIPNVRERTDDYMLAEHKRVAARIRGLGGFPVINHPRSWQAAISFPEAFTDSLTIFEGMEIWNGATPCIPGFPNDLAFRLWRDRLDHGVYVPAVCGSDTHNIKANDYQAISEALRSIRDRGGAVYGGMPEMERRGYDWIIKASEAALRLYEAWAEECLGTGCVRNMVSTDKEDAAGILDAMRRGRNVLTNGPLMFVRVDGVGPGGRVCFGKLDAVQVELYSKKPLRVLKLLGRGVERDVPLEARGTRYGLMDYSVNIAEAGLGDSDYIVIVADGGVTNMAIANPVFVDKC
ncbi:MAG: CehA/McbA family metallohydrolase [Oscillospiraceae bacterium]|nr:CehA/McbA family metallohydrolase [Oscillospiraceae bacterium]